MKRAEARLLRCQKKDNLLTKKHDDEYAFDPTDVHFYSFEDTLSVHERAQRHELL